jgi:hypothetical protein
MAARIVEGANLSFPVAQDNDGIPPDVERHIITGAGDLAAVAGKDPIAREDRFQIDREDIRIQVERLWQAVAGPPVGQGLA